jgi:tight adherence protein B
MFIDTTIFIYILLFIGTLLFIEGIYFLVHDMRVGSERQINRRLRLIGSESDPRTVLRRMRREERSRVGQIVAQALPRLDRFITQSGLSIRTGQFVALMSGLTIAALLILAFGTALPLWQSLLMAIGFGCVIPLLVLYRRRKSRLKKFAEQLPDTLDLLVRSLRAGHPMTAAFTLVSREMPDPMGSEFGVMQDEMTYGLGLEEALNSLMARVPQQDLRFFVVSIQIQRQSGGNLAEILSNLSTVIRDRFRMFAKVRALSAEGRFSGAAIGVMPLVLYGILNLTAPSFYGDVVGDPLFVLFISIAVTLLLIGHIVIWKMVNFRF